MATPSEFTITVDGPVGFEKSRIAEAVQDALSDNYMWVHSDPKHGAFYPRGLLRHQALAGIVVHIVERTPVTPNPGIA